MSYCESCKSVTDDDLRKWVEELASKLAAEKERHLDYDEVSRANGDLASKLVAEKSLTKKNGEGWAAAEAVAAKIGPLVMDLDAAEARVRSLEKAVDNLVDAAKDYRKNVRPHDERHYAYDDLLVNALEDFAALQSPPHGIPSDTKSPPSQQNKMRCPGCQQVKPCYNCATPDPAPEPKRGGEYWFCACGYMSYGPVCNKCGRINGFDPEPPRCSHRITDLACGGADEKAHEGDAEDGGYCPESEPPSAAPTHKEDK